MTTDTIEKIAAEMETWTWTADRTPSVVMRDWAQRLRALPSAELERDAARYRWLRDDQTSHLYVRHNDNGQIEVATGATLDALIDARASEAQRQEVGR